MRRIGGVWQEVISADNLYEAFRSARRGKRGRIAVAAFCLNWERELQNLQQLLRNRTYVPGDYRQFTIYERKARLISAAPFRDRVVHHALMRVVAPFLERRMYFHSYACRPGKGVHQAVDVYEQWAWRHPYVLKADLKQYFPSIDRILLLEEIARYVKDKGCLWLFDLIINHAPPTATAAPLFPGDDLLTALDRPRGLPIGNLTSQLLANLYLNRVDHWIAAVHPGPYLRYVDDVFVFGCSKESLWALQGALAERLAALRLQLHPNKANVMRTDRKVDVLGYQMRQGMRWLRGENVHRAGRRLRALARGFAAGTLDAEHVRQSVEAWKGHLSHAGAWALCRRLLCSIVFRQKARVPR